LKTASDFWTKPSGFSPPTTKYATSGAWRFRNARQLQKITALPAFCTGNRTPGFGCSKPGAIVFLLIPDPLYLHSKHCSAMKHTLFFLIFIFSANFALGQRTLKGKVTNAQGVPLPGCYISERGTSNSAVSGMDGTFTLSFSSPESVIQFIYTGLTTQEITPFRRTFINVSMKPDASFGKQTASVGSRLAGRTLLETPVPIDIFNLDRDALATGRNDIASMLTYNVPSFNYNKQTGAEGADHFGFASLRGLSPNQVLVLVNGKRRHQSAFLSILGTRGRGSSGVDLNAIAAGAVDRMEILRDGDAAQYGSDAIAGVVNIITKNTANKLTANIGWSGFSDNKFNTVLAKDQSQYHHEGQKIDGNAIKVDLNYGIPLGKKGGFANFTLDYVNQGKTFRQPSNTDILPVNTVRRGFGEASFVNYGGVLNAELPFGKGATAYFFADANQKKSDAFEYSVNFSDGPEQFVTDKNGKLVDIPGVIRSNKDGERYFDPKVKTDIADYSGTFGLRGEMSNKWRWDVSGRSGRSKVDFVTIGTLNASSNDPKKNNFDNGGVSFAQNILNAEFSKQNKGLGLAFGAEFRQENYKINAGEEGSYITYKPNIYRIDSIFENRKFIGLDTTFKHGGAEGFHGFRPSDAVNAKRTVAGVFADVEYEVTKEWLIGASARFENYSDFGFNHNYKVKTAYKVSPNFNLRGSASTGYRAPSLQELNYGATFVNEEENVEVEVERNGGKIAEAAGVGAIKAERSVHLGLGFAARLAEGLNLTVDGYVVKVKDRVILSGVFNVNDKSLNSALINAMRAEGVDGARFFKNSVDNTNQGIDLVLDFNRKVNTNHSIQIQLAAAIQKITVDKVNIPKALGENPNFYNTREDYFLIHAAPHGKGTFNVTYDFGKVALGLRTTYFGAIELYGLGEDGTGVSPVVPTDKDPRVKVADLHEYRGKFVNDLYLSAGLLKDVTLYFGVDNLLNVHPDFGYVPEASKRAFNTESGGAWDSVQMGPNGRRLFARVAVGF
jgi:iron complex outermembrane recepter protein